MSKDLNTINTGPSEAGDIADEDSDRLLIDILDEEDANDEENGSTLDEEQVDDVFEDINLNLSALKAVIPKDMSGRPHISTGFREALNLVDEARNDLMEEEDVNWSTI